MPNGFLPSTRFGRLLPRRAAEEVFTPAWYDLALDYATLHTATTGGARLLAWLSFRMHELLLWLDCWRLVLTHPADLLASPIPPEATRPTEHSVNFLSDRRFAARSLAREPLFAVFVVCTLALGIGANAAMFGVVDRLLVRGAEHVTDAPRVQRFYLRDPEAGKNSRGYSAFGYVSYDLFRRNTRSFESVGAYAVNPNSLTFGEGSDAQLLNRGAATADLFPLLGVHAAVGRFFSDEEDNTGSPQHVVVLGDGLWMRNFAADPNVVGRTVSLGGETYTIVGVAPRGFTGPELTRVDVWIPMSLQSQHVTQQWTTSWNAQWLHIVARLKPDVTSAQAGADATTA